MFRWQWAVIPSSRASPRCCSPMSASVQTVETRATVARRRRGRSRGRAWCRCPAGSRRRSARARTTPRRPRAARRRSAAGGRTGSSSRRARRRGRPRSPTPRRGRAPVRRVVTWSTRYWCAIAWEPSRRVVSTILTADGALIAAASRVQLGDADGGRGHDVEVAGVRRQVVAGTLDLDHHGREAVGDQRRRGRAGSRGRRRRPRRRRPRPPPRSASGSAVRHLERRSCCAS